MTARFAASDEGMEGPVFRRDVERARSAPDERRFGAATASDSDWRREFQQLREAVEARARLQDRAVAAMLTEFAARELGNATAEAVEARIKLAAREAMAYAAQGLQVHQEALRALSRRVDALARQPTRAETPIPRGDITDYVLGRGPFGAGDGVALQADFSAEENLVASLGDLAVAPGGAARLIAWHVLQYAPGAAIERDILPHWRSRLAPGGELLVVTCDGPAYAADLARQAGDFEALRRRLGADGAARPPRTLFSEGELARLLEGAGFADVRRMESDDPLELRLSARAGP